MAVTALVYGLGAQGQFSATAARRVDWVSDTIKVALTTSSYTPNQDTHDFFNDITNEISGTGYSAGGVALASKSSTYDAASNTLRLDADDASWTTATFTCRYAIVYKDTGSGATSPLLGYIDFGGDQSVVSGTFTVVWDSTDGVMRAVVT